MSAASSSFTAPRSAQPALPAVFRELFFGPVERSRLLRSLTFGASTWAAVSTAWVTGTPWPLAAVPGFALAHVVGYSTLRRRARWDSRSGLEL